VERLDPTILWPDLNWRDRPANPDAEQREWEERRAAAPYDGPQPDYWKATLDAYKAQWRARGGRVLPSEFCQCAGATFAPAELADLLRHFRPPRDPSELAMATGRLLAVVDGRYDPVPVIAGWGKIEEAPPIEVSASRLVTHTTEELANLPEPGFLLPDLVVANGLNILAGATASFKTFLASQVIALPLVEEGRRVIYVSAEGQRGIYPRASAWAHYHGKERPLPAVEWITSSGFHLVNDAEDLAKLGKADLIVIDTLRRTTAGLAEDKSDDFARITEAIDYVRGCTGAAFLLLDHTGWGGERERGSSAKRDMADLLMVTKRDGTEHQPGSTVTLRCVKLKDAEEWRPKRYRLDKGEHGSAVLLPSDQFQPPTKPDAPVWTVPKAQAAIAQTHDVESTAVEVSEAPPETLAEMKQRLALGKHPEVQAAILAALADGQKSQRDSLREVVGVDTGLFRTALREMVTAGLVRQTGAGVKGAPYYYSLP
jgi:hypothetical protein